MSFTELGPLLESVGRGITSEEELEAVASKIQKSVDDELFFSKNIQL